MSRFTVAVFLVGLLAGCDSSTQDTGSVTGLWRTGPGAASFHVIALDVDAGTYNAYELWRAADTPSLACYESREEGTITHLGADRYNMRGDWQIEGRFSVVRDTLMILADDDDDVFKLARDPRSEASLRPCS